MSSYLYRADDDYVTPELYSFEFVPLYIIVGVFPVLLVSTLIYNIWEKKAAGYLVSKYIHNFITCSIIVDSLTKSIR